MFLGSYNQLNIYDLRAYDVYYKTRNHIYIQYPACQLFCYNPYNDFDLFAREVNVLVLLIRLVRQLRLKKDLFWFFLSAVSKFLVVSCIKFELLEASWAIAMERLCSEEHFTSFTLRVCVFVWITLNIHNNLLYIGFSSSQT